MRVPTDAEILALGLVLPFGMANDRGSPNHCGRSPRGPGRRDRRVLPREPPPDHRVMAGPASEQDRQSLGVGERRPPVGGAQDRKSTRLNSSHMSISYAVFCLKKKNKQP